MTDVEDCLDCVLSEDDLFKISETYKNTVKIMDLAKNLRHLEALPEIKTTLLNAATGKRHIDIETFDKVLSSMRWMYGIVIAALVFIIVFLMTGERLGLIHLFRS